ncbi:transmembrane protein 53 isoform X2 [Coregonus clupeaformis]|uniref:transmembrane protein 53 isoform X2 n=1 Tax=Coregonus clupeaformis TaxID=59861 RepID=UPI001BE0A71B|nr:transmembrane protein 53 isoform X2 [Coregonus clupeaformis]
MANDGMDYNIVFPDALISDRHWHGTNEPVVILLGWAGCRDKHLAKYSSIYNEQGCVTICYTAPLKTVFISESFGYKELSNTAHKLLEILYDYEVENSPIFFHVFSNGGFMLYRYIVELLHNHKQFSTLCIVGAVVDSAPGSGNVRGALRALTDTLGPKINVMLRYVLLALFAVTVFLLRVVLYPVTKYIHKDHYDAIRECPPTWPHLYLYSRADRVIRNSDVELMVKALKEKGVSVESFDFKTPAHVSHFRDFPEEYSKRCLAFLTNCMKDSEGTQTKKRHLIQH